jgi:hypothetical protein
VSHSKKKDDQRWQNEAHMIASDHENGPTQMQFSDKEYGATKPWPVAEPSRGARSNTGWEGYLS